MGTPTLASDHGWRAALRDWTTHVGPQWLYFIKVIAAGLLALALAMRLDLAQPRTALTTVFIVMQPQSGMVFAKSFYRLLGTVIGSLVTLVLVGMFAQDSVLFLVLVALWIAACTAGAAYNRNFRSYGFVLAGYTAALIGIPLMGHPTGAFAAAVTRVTEVSLGVVCAGAVSAVWFPRRATDALVAALRGRFAALAQLAANSLGSRAERPALQSAMLRLTGELVGIEALRSSAVFEDPETRARAGQFARLNSELMDASTRLHALLQLRRRLLEARAPQVVNAFDPCAQACVALFDALAARPVTADTAAETIGDIEALRARLPMQLRAARASLEAALNTDETFGGDVDVDAGASAGADAGAGAEMKPQSRGSVTAREHLRDFDTAAELLDALLTACRAYAVSYAALSDAPSGASDAHRYVPHTDAVTALLTGMRAGVLMLIVSAFWIQSAWPSGAVLVLNAATICAICSTFPSPGRTARQMTIGAALAVGAAYVCLCYVYPLLDGFVMLSLGLIPFLLFGLLVTAQPRFSGVGAGFCIFFCFLGGPENPMRYDIAGLLNDGVALVLALGIAALAFGVLAPPDSRWMLRRAEKALRRQVVRVAAASGPAAARRFDSGTRDLMHQAEGLLAAHPDARAELLGWIFSVLEVGHALAELDQLESPGQAQAPALVTVRRALAAVFERPGPARHAQALAAVEAALAHIDAADTAGLATRAVLYLHLIRTALLDPATPLAGASRNAGAPHRVA